MTREEMINAVVEARVESMADAGWEVVWQFIRETLQHEYGTQAVETLIQDHKRYVEGDD